MSTVIDGLNKKSKIIGSALTTAEQDLEAFQVGICRNHSHEHCH